MRVMSLTASNSSRLTTSRSRRIFSAWARQSVSTSFFMPCAAPAASFIRRPIWSKKGLVVWVMKQLRGPTVCATVLSAENGDRRGGVQEAAKRPLATSSLVTRRFPCIRMNGLANPTYQDTAHRNGTRDAMIDQQLNIPTGDGQTTTSITRRRNLAGL